MERDICPEEYATARQHQMVGRGNLLPDCQDLPENLASPQCNRLLGDFNELPRDGIIFKLFILSTFYMMHYIL